MPGRVYLEKTNVISAITLALQSATEQRPKDPVDHVANFLLQYHHNLIQQQQSEQT